MKLTLCLLYLTVGLNLICKALVLSRVLRFPLVAEFWCSPPWSRCPDWLILITWPECWLLIGQRVQHPADWAHHPVVNDGRGPALRRPRAHYPDNCPAKISVSRKQTVNEEKINNGYFTVKITQDQRGLYDCMCILNISGHSPYHQRSAAISRAGTLLCKTCPGTDLLWILN